MPTPEIVPAGRNGLTRVDIGLVLTILVWGVNDAVIKAALGERWTPGQFAGAAAVLAGIALTRRPQVPAACARSSLLPQPPDAS